jgi:ribose transport system permease protein
VNALLLGGIAAYSHNTGRSATDNLSSFAIDKTLGIPNTVFVALTFIVAFWFILSRTTGGWRFTAVSTSAQAGQAAGPRVDRYTVTTYVLAAMCFATAGILLAGYVRTPALDIGNPYLLATITAVVIGGTPLGGGRGSVIGTALAALFLTQLTAFTDALSAPPSTILLVQAVAIAVAVLGRSAAVGAVVRCGIVSLRKPKPASRPSGKGFPPSNSCYTRRARGRLAHQQRRRLPRRGRRTGLPRPAPGHPVR